MRVLIVKTSSMGDIIHTLPAVQDALKAQSNLEFHWLIEKNFSEIPTWIPAVTRVIPIELRRWRRNIFSAETHYQLKQLWQNLRKDRYDLVIDPQGLSKSALFALCAKGPVTGYHWHSAREPIASLFYRKKIVCDYQKHAIDRIRILFAHAFGYTLPDLTKIDYGLLVNCQKNENVCAKPYIIFFHTASTKEKLWFSDNWIQLGQALQVRGYRILLPWGNMKEQLCAKHIANYLDPTLVSVLPRLTLSKLRHYILYASACVSVDTGLAHLAAALNQKNCVLYGKTNPHLIGTRGLQQHHYRMAHTTPAQIFARIDANHDPLTNLDFLNSKSQY